MRNSKASRAFTLVELLVVVGIIAVVIALLLPTLAKARQSAKSAMCLANMRTFANAAANFEAQNKGGLVLDTLQLLPNYNGNAGVSGRISICPALADYQSDVQSYANAVLTTYSWNDWLVGINARIAPGLFHPSSSKNGSEVALLADSIGITPSGGLSFTSNSGLQDPFNSGANYWPGKPPPLPALCAPTFHGRHNGRGAVLWLDGHATMVVAVLPQPNTRVANVSNVVQAASMYTKYQIGYLVRSQSDLSSINGLYYFVSKKGALSQNDINAYLALNTSAYPQYYSVNPSAW